MNRKQRMIAAHRAIAQKAFDAKLEYSTTFTFAACVLALEKAHAKVKWDTFFRNFAETYPEVLRDPNGMVKQAEEILGGEIEFHWTE